MSKRRKDVVRETSAQAHADQPGSDRKHAEAGRWARRSRRTLNRYGNEGPPQLRDAQLYLMDCPNPFRPMATLVASQKQNHMKTLTTEELKARYREVVRKDKEGEAADTNHDICRETPWLDRALSSERDAALDSEKAAIEREFAARNVPIEEVLS